MDLSKVIDTMNQELLIAKLNSYGFEKDSFKTTLELLKLKLAKDKDRYSS